jgi:DNA-binding MarR family transcriptional regulator
MVDKLRAYKDTELSPKAMLVYLYLCGRSGRESKTCFPSIKTISREVKLSESSVKRSLNELLERQYITKEHRFRNNGGKSSNLYYIL